MSTIVLFEDDGVEFLGGLALCRSADTIGFGGTSIRQELQRDGHELYLAIRPSRADLGQLRGQLPSPPPLFTSPWMMVNARAIPGPHTWRILTELSSGDARVFVTEDRHVLAARLVPSVPVPADWTVAGLAGWASAVALPIEAANGKLLLHAHETVRELPQTLAFAIERTLERSGHRQVTEGVFADPQLEIPGHVAFDTRQGPIVLDAGIEFGAFCSLVGPVRIGKHTRLREHTSIRGPVSIGENCKIGGELEFAMVDDFSNKGHFGYLGHSYVGSWVNLGAGTTCSNLKHSYGEINVDYGIGRVATGMQFLGSIIYDFARTSIHCSIMTGKVLGVGSCSYGLVAENVPPFVNFAKQFGSVTALDLASIGRSVERMMARRGETMSAGQHSILRNAYDRTMSERVGLSVSPPRF